jgi:hypothetical protein
VLAGATFERPKGWEKDKVVGEKGVSTLKRFIPVFGLLVVLACLSAGGASALTFQDRTCDNSKPTCPMPAGSAEVPYQFDMYARSGCPPYHYNVTGGTMPQGLTLSTVNDPASGGIGRVSGTPTTPGDYSFWVTITTPEQPTCLGDRADRLFTISIGPAPLSIKTQSLRRGVVGEPYTETLTAGGGGNPSWSANGLPAGLSISGNTITGTPTTAGDYTVTVTVTKGTETKSAQYALKIIEPLKVTAPVRRTAEVGRLFATTLSATGGSGSYSWVATDLPAGLVFDATTHAISGTPTIPGTYTVKVVVTDSPYGLVQPLDLRLKVVPHVAIATRILRAATAGKAYALKIRAGGGLAPFRWRSLGKLPAGIRLDAAAGALVGVPRTAGNFRITLRVTDGLRASATKTLVLKVHA